MSEWYNQIRKDTLVTLLLLLFKYSFNFITLMLKLKKYIFI